MKIFRGGDIEIECAWNRNIRDSGSGKRRDNDAGMRPEEGLQSLAPSIGRSKKIKEALLILRAVAPSCNFELNLAAQRDGVNCFSGVRIAQPKLESKLGCSRKRRHFYLFDLETSGQACDSCILRALLLSPLKNCASSCHTSVPPERPRQWVRMIPTSL